ncbi:MULTISPECIES: hypothetical protein [unclassified Lactococcus]|uniref:hypothetical protein n=1 Tax=unclassified Lactococcus TaxID=2643510 RepID=UPI0011C72EF9|nr:MULTISPECIES: hypothetical protein [unclassified Lactococcus]MQW22152.1 hypothetical protein [Lactococcus sp. dk101]TXK45088.1 hypothetical protein FVP42_02430 [Lactococcus sp. dk310]TXK51132.1 hypothetical protein FVP43_02660 [Lactococcus sp. dk322]
MIEKNSNDGGYVPSKVKFSSFLGIFISVIVITLSLVIANYFFTINFAVYTVYCILRWIKKGSKFILYNDKNYFVYLPDTKNERGPFLWHDVTDVKGHLYHGRIMTGFEIKINGFDDAIYFSKTDVNGSIDDLYRLFIKKIEPLCQY